MLLVKLELGRCCEKTKSVLRRLSEISSEKSCLNKKSCCDWFCGVGWFLRRLQAGVKTSAVW